MNVIILTKTFPETPEDWSGIFVREQAEAIATEHKVTVVKCRVDYNKFRPFFSFITNSDSASDYNYYRIVVAKSFPVYNQLNFIISAYLALFRIIVINKPDIIHCHYSYPAGIVAWLIRLRTGIPYIVTEHTRIKSTFRSVFHKFLSLLALRKASGVIAVSNSLKKELLNEQITKIKVIPNVIKTERFTLAERRADLFTIGFLGSLISHNKGLDILLAACRELPFNFKLKIGGAGILQQYYMDLAHTYNLEDKVVFHGAIDPKQINSFYTDINLFILPSRYETFGIVLIEAMAAGIPVIATRCGGPEDIVNDINGLLIEKGNAIQLRDAIIKIHSNYSKYNTHEIRNYVIKTFGFTPFIQRINSLYKSCLRDKIVDASP
jgi:glycosyltransferase involved in cell wall biosynthesis